MTRYTRHSYACCVAEELADDVCCGFSWFSYKGDGGCEPLSIDFTMFLCDRSLMPSKDEHPTYIYISLLDILCFTSVSTARGAYLPTVQYT